MQCPFDATPLQVVNRSGIEIDWCPSCKGVWLERGELDKLIDQAGATAAPLPPPAPRNSSRPQPERTMSESRRHDWDDDDDDDWDDRRYDDRSRSRKRSSLLSEIFDF